MTNRNEHPQSFEEEKSSINVLQILLADAVVCIAIAVAMFQAGHPWYLALPAGSFGAAIVTLLGCAIYVSLETLLVDLSAKFTSATKRSCSTRLNQEIGG